MPGSIPQAASHRWVDVAVRKDVSPHVWLLWPSTTTSVCPDRTLRGLHFEVRFWRLPLPPPNRHRVSADFSKKKEVLLGQSLFAFWNHFFLRRVISVDTVHPSFLSEIFTTGLSRSRSSLAIQLELGPRCGSCPTDGLYSSTAVRMYSNCG